MKILALDSSGPVVTLGVAGEKEILAERQFAPAGRTVALLAPEIVKILKQLNIKAADLDGFALGAGPGSFTGLKVGFAAILGLAFAKEQPIWTYPSLHLTALTLAKSKQFREKEAGAVAVRADSGGFGLSFGVGKGVQVKPKGSQKILVLTEAKKGYFYKAVFRPFEEGVQETAPVTAIKIEELAGPDEPVWVTGSALESHREEIESRMKPTDKLASKELWHPSAGLLAQMAASGRLGAPAGKEEALEPIFLKSFETKFKEVSR